jgi:hypothetical protein
MQYMIMLNESKAEFEDRTHPERAQTYWASWKAFIGAMGQAGIIVRGDGLQGPEVSTTLRVRDGKRVVQDGPFADTKEQLGGYFIIEVADLDAALDWAAKAPCVHRGSVEVRPVMPMNASG